MLIRTEPPQALLGSNLIQYFPRRNWCFIRGEVTEVNDNEVLADFGDTVIKFCKTDIFYAIDTDLGEEHFATTSCGTLKSDYRKPLLKSGTVNEVSVEYRGRRRVR